MSVITDHIYFRPIISAACFKISFSISNFSIFLRSSINSVSSSVRLSSSLNEPELSYCLTQRSNVEGFKSYSLIISLRGLLFLYSNTNCFLNSVEKVRRCLLVIKIHSTITNILISVTDLIETVQLSVTYPRVSIAMWNLKGAKVNLRSDEQNRNNIRGSV